MNLYEILEVSENASEETINKIYKIQAKKYHPDLQESEGDKLKAEEKMKKINEAYSILSDEQKRKDYDNKLKLEREREKQAEQEKIMNNIIHEQQNNNYKTKNVNVEYQKQVQSQNSNKIERKPYTQKDYIRDYKKRLRKAKMQLIGNNIKDDIKALLIMATIMLIIWIFPPTHNFLVELYKENIVLQTIVDIFKNIINSFKN